MEGFTLSFGLLALISMAIGWCLRPQTAIIKATFSSYGLSIDLTRAVQARLRRGHRLLIQDVIPRELLDDECELEVMYQHPNQRRIYRFKMVSSSIMDTSNHHIYLPDENLGFYDFVSASLLTAADGAELDVTDELKEVLGPNQDFHASLLSKEMEFVYGELSWLLACDSGDVLILVRSDGTRASFSADTKVRCNRVY
jgi:hypothetical protein